MPSASPPVPQAGPDRPRSLFVNGHFPRRRGLVVCLAALFGFALTVVWSHEFVDQTIGANVAGALLGQDAATASLSGSLAGIAFALATGVAGTFTACNVAVFSAVAPLAGRTRSRRDRSARLLRPLGYLAAGSVAVSAVYGVVVALVGTGMPQFRLGSPGAGGFPPVLVQAMVVFGIIGAVMVWLGLASLGLVPDPLARVSARFPNAPLVVMGALIGGFLIGRPYPLFRRLFHDAAESGNVLYGAASFSLQALGNLVVMGVLFVLVSLLAGERLHRWMSAHPGRASAVIAAAFIAAGVFMVLYWDVRILAYRDLIWFPMAPWA
ncbi:hypothetical protein F0L17_26250 [Streptomyces sp. TRM43335]|uniref:Cytochrome C biogenesis protein transmembrane region n=1 Tax=Streptomyces taklimakanensis TaxID=2569853 RepID=A0A6G2BJZ6_9ACTN|nr:hypothetical protein [Streptomyces taklimakanensis]